MPYRVSKKQGGDSSTNTRFMEKCVKRITGTNPRTNKPWTKGEKIAICKKSLERRKNND